MRIHGDSQYSRSEFCGGVSQQTIKQGCDVCSNESRKKETKLNGPAGLSIGNEVIFCWGVLNQRKKERSFACRTEGKKKESVCIYV